ncbi:MAG: hypothetical protein ABWZ98_16905 [Nakamurella sp.]
MDAALLALPSHGWRYGWTGRRDRALLVLSQMAGLSFQAIAELTVADIQITDGIATIRTPGGATTLRSATDGRICGPCALARWLHALDLTAIYPHPGVVTAVLARAAALTANSPHLCVSPAEVCERTLSLPVLPSIDQWGPCATGSRSSQVGMSDPGADGNTKRPRPFARPFITRHPETESHDSLRGATPAGPVTDRATATLSGVGTAPPSNSLPGLPVQPRFPKALSDGPRWVDPTILVGRLDLTRSNYSRADREAIPGQTARRAEGLEGRARALLERRAE